MSLASESKILLQHFIQKPSYLTSLTPSIPFRLFRSSKLYTELKNMKHSLPLNRFTDPLALSDASCYVSVWSESHLKFLKLSNETRSTQMERVLLKNPFKTQKLIKDCLDYGLNTMVVDSFQELWKIHECRLLNKTQGFQKIPINFVWMVSDPETDLRQIQTLKCYNIKLAGLCFDQTHTNKIADVKQFITRANDGLSEKNRLRMVYLESESQQFDRTNQAYQSDQFFSKNKIQTILEKTDFKMTDKYWIAARVIGETKRREPVLNEEAYKYISPEQARKGRIIQKDGKTWIFSSISHFPEGEMMEEHERKGYIMNMI